MFWDVVPNGLFASLFFGVFDLEASALAFVNAGHHYPFLVTRARARCATSSRAARCWGSSRTRPTSRAACRSGPDDLFVFY